ncbi:MAG: hypothetical protein IJV24_00110 [Prevotella sp.]|nr:hypothetical protein [Prevotella sp.]
MIDLLFYVIYAMLAMAVGLTGWSVVRSLTCNRSEAVVGRIPVRSIAWATVALLAVVLAVSYACGSTQPMVVNGQTFVNGFWLRVADMFIYTSAVLIAVAVVGVLFGASGLSRKLKK